MAALETVTLISACVAIPLSVLSIKIAADAGQQDLRVAQGQIVVHFIDRFHDMADAGEGFDDDDWLLRYWRLVTEEFYFFDNMWLPVSIYRIWIIELVTRAYDSQPSVWESHKRYLEEVYSYIYPRMYEFFLQVHSVAQKQYATSKERNTAIAQLVEAEHRSRRKLRDRLFGNC